MTRAYSFSAAGGHGSSVNENDYTGRNRSHLVNEDAFVLQPLPDGGWLVALADGQGGRAGGRRAAQLACEVAARGGLAEDADAAVAADPAAGFTTLVVLRVEGGRVTGASCGDSAAVAVCGGDAPRVLTSRQFKNPPVGSGEATFMPFEAELVRPWRVLAMTDGVWKYIGWQRIHELAAKAQPATEPAAPAEPPAAAEPIAADVPAAPALANEPQAP